MARISQGLDLYVHFAREEWDVVADICILGDGNHDLGLEGLRGETDIERIERSDSAMEKQDGLDKRKTRQTT